jgi:hypothetical protein
VKRLSWQVWLGILLILLSFVLYAVHYIVFRDFHHIFIYFLGDLAFVPVEVLLVTLIVHRLLSERERKRRMEKLYMVIGGFFSEVGITLLSFISDWDPKLEKIRSSFAMNEEWTDREFDSLMRDLSGYPFDVDVHLANLVRIKRYLSGKRDFLLRLLENPTLLEHERFTGMLRAVFHLDEELEARDDVQRLPESDLRHLRGDVKRIYGLLVMEWIEYMRHLKDQFPYLFSLAMRTNPFDRDVSAVVAQMPPKRPQSRG